ncbi:MAG: Jag N-terminal domain-containing protein [Anaerolineaceae bacterium]|nr:Jag N-terminal domain-containing protein [Anaerolineaceae bacterium]
MNVEESIEVTGDDVEQALARGLEMLGVGPDDVMVEVLEEPASGMFGLGSRPARVRLRLLTAASPPETEDASGAADTTGGSAPALQDPASTADGNVADKAPGDLAFQAPMETTTFGEGDFEEDAEVGKVVLAELLENMAVRADVEVRRAEATDEEEPPWMLDIVGESDLSVLIGRKGETLASLQYITRLVTSRELQRRANIVVDVGGYKSRRMNRLYALASRMADQATSLGRPVALEPMPPYERRIVHLALREREDVTTESSGEGQARKVNIIPAPR